VVVLAREGLGLLPVVLRLLTVADTGSLGGGMLSCLGGCGGYSASRSLVAFDTPPCWDKLAFDVLLFHPRLNFLLSEVPFDDGV
jgi:hypothetical protein